MNNENNNTNITNDNSMNNGLINEQPNRTPNLYSEKNTYNSNNNSNNNSVNTKNRKSKKFICMIVMMISMIAAAYFGYKIIWKEKNTDNEKVDIQDSTTFFLYNKENKYALFNEDGKQLTEFIYDGASDFINGKAYVRKDGKSGIIDTTGKTTVDFGKYKHIIQNGGIYKATTKENHDYLIDGNGKVLYDLKNAILHTFSSDLYSILEKDNKYTVLNYNGKKIVSFPKVKNASKPEANEKYGHISIFYNNKNYILNAHTGKTITSFDSGEHYCVDDMTKDEKKIQLDTCKSIHGKQNKTYYKIIDKKKVIDLSNYCEEIYIFDNNIECNNDGEHYLLDSNYKKSLNIDHKAYRDNNNYIQNKTGNLNDGVDFYSNGKVIKNVPCRLFASAYRQDGYMHNNLYVLATSPSSTCKTEAHTYEFYQANGEKAFDKSFVQARAFDKNGNAVVSDDEKNYYLINTEGKQISKTYDLIEFIYGYYIVWKDSKNGILDKDGKEIAPCEYSKFDFYERKNTFYVRLFKKDDSMIYNLKTHQQILNEAGWMYNHYIISSSNEKTQYYSYTTGKMFYER